MGSERDWKCEVPSERAAYAATAREALHCIEGKWKIVILCQLFALGTLRFSELERLIEGVTQKMLIQQLKELEQDGIVKRAVYPQVPPKVEYSLTEVGRGLGPAMAALLDWFEMRREHFCKRQRFRRRGGSSRPHRARVDLWGHSPGVSPRAIFDSSLRDEEFEAALPRDDNACLGGGVCGIPCLQNRETLRQAKDKYGALRVAVG